MAGPSAPTARTSRRVAVPIPLSHPSMLSDYSFSPLGRNTPSSQISEKQKTRKTLETEIGGKRSVGEAARHDLFFVFFFLSKDSKRYKVYEKW